ncbi:MAG TPA: hypothetical protein VMV27_08840 [Candidatus Binataceae bacterium]|nr:hypothetical protein [Candidatus Binataceae bacterium]
MTPPATRSHDWPPRLRAMSFAITVGVVGLEAALAALPIAALLWLCGAATSRAFGVAAIVALGWGLLIALYSHITAVGLPRKIFNGTGR